ncbi:MAG: cytochrome c oxidase subunit 2 [Psychromonas sp.]|jgi:cytochrome c oxidase subunit 2|uniref:cytochrome c oxidase subunit II n=1 Tax=Psychromonas sp. TaxID=1884585 RepID=UPI0039E54F3D
MIVIRVAILLTLFIAQLSSADSAFNMREGVTDISENVYQLHMTIFLICCAIALVVFGIMFWSIFHHRKSKGVKAAQFHESTKIEVLWTAIPFVILIAMAVPATKTLIAMEDNSKADITIKVTGSQWKWHYQYLTYNNEILDIDFYSVISTPQAQINNRAEKTPNYLLEVDKPLVVPINKKIRFVITSDDVIHSWWVPDFAIKQDAVPGFINEAWARINEIGIYRGQCAELCGKNHGFMPIVVNAMAVDDFDNWLAMEKIAKQKQAQEALASQSTSFSKAQLMTLGEQVYVGHCSVCHQPTGSGLPGVFPALKGSPIATGDVNAHINIVLKGKAGTAMQSFAKQLSLKELAAVVTYERNAWGNDTGDLVQPIEISNAMNAEASATFTTTSDTLTTTTDIQPDAAIEVIPAQEAVNDEIKLEADKSTPALPLSSLTKAQLMDMGEQVYAQACSVCHQPTGLGITGAFPALKDSPIVKGDIESHINLVLNGKSGTAMQSFAAQLSLEELAAVVTYERNAWGNESGDLVQPSDVDKVSKGEALNEQTISTEADAVEETPVSAGLTKEQLMTSGEQHYLTFCAACHQPTGLGVAPVFPALKGSPIATGAVAEHLDIVLNGKAGSAMQAFAQQLSAEQLAAIITYERNAWGNESGDLVQPNDIVQAIKGEQ